MELSDYDYLNRSLLSDDFLKIISNQKEIILEIYIRDLLLSIEVNDRKTILDSVINLYYVNMYKNIPVDKMKIIIISLEKSIEKNITELKFLNHIIKYLSKTMNTYKYFIDFNFNWKLYYKIYEMIKILGKKNCLAIITEKKDNYLQNLVKYIKKIKKHFIYTQEDYDFLTKEINKYIHSNRTLDISTGLDIAKNFLPDEFFYKDIELQKKFFDLNIKHPEFTNSIMLIFKETIRKYNDILLDKELFINSFFELLINYFSNSANKIGKDSSNLNKAKKIKQKYSISYSMCFIFTKIVTSDEYLLKYKNLIDKNMRVLINFMDLNLGETFTELADIILTAMGGIFIAMKKILFKKEFIYLNKISVQSRYIPIKENKEKILRLLDYFLPLIIKCLFYYEEDSTMLMEALMDITLDYEVNDKILNTFIHLFSQCEIDINLFYLKIASYINVLLNYKNLKNQKCAELINQIILRCPDFITSAQEGQTKSILEFLCAVYAVIQENIDNEEYKKLKNYSLITKSLFNVSVDIVVRMFQLFDFISNNTIHYKFYDFIYFCCQINTQENIDKIKNIILSYPKDNYITKDFIANYLIVIYYSNLNLNEMSTQLWENTLNLFLVKSKDENLVKNKHCLINYDLSSINFSIEERKKEELKYFKEFISCMEFGVFTKKEQWKEIIEVSILCINNKDKRYNKLGITILGRLISCLLSQVYNHDTKKFGLPGEEIISFIKKLYEIFLLPYINYVKDIIKSFNDMKDKFGGNPQEEDALNWYNSNFEDENILSYIMLILFKLLSLFTIEKDNPFLLSYLNIYYDENYDKYKDFLKLMKEINLFCIDIYPFLKEIGLLKNDKLNKYYLNLLLYESIDQNKKTIDKYITYIKQAKVYYIHNDYSKLGILEFLNHQFFISAMQRYFKNDFSSDSLKRVGMEKYNIVTKEEIEYTKNKLNIIKSIFISSSSDRTKDYFFDSFYGLCIKIPDEEWEVIYNNIYEEIYQKLKKKVDKPKSFTNSKKMNNLLYFFSTALTYTLQKMPVMFAKIFEDLTNIIQICKEDLHINITINILEAKLLKKKQNIPMCYSLLKKRLPLLESFSVFKEIDTSQSDKVIKNYINCLNVNIEEYAKKSNEKIIKQNKTIRNFIIKFINNFDDKVFLVPTVNQFVSMYTVELMSNVLDPTDPSDNEIISTCIKKLYYMFLENDVCTLNMDKILASLMSLLFRLQFPNLFYYKKIRYDPINKPMSQDEFYYYLKNYNRNKTFICNNNLIYIIEKVKDTKLVENYNKFLLKSKEELHSFILALIRSKDLLINEKLIKSNAKDSVLNIDTLNKLWEYRLLFHIFSLNYNEELLTYTNIIDIFDSIEKMNKFDNNTISIVKLQVLSSMIKRDIRSNKENIDLSNSIDDVNYSITQKYKKPSQKKVEEIQNILYSIMMFYTNGQNKILDSMIIKCFKYIITSCTLSDLLIYFKDVNTNQFIYFSKGNEFALQIYNIICTSFISLRTCCFYNNYQPTSIVNSSKDSDLRKHFDLLEYYLNNQNKLISQAQTVTLLTESLLQGAKAFYYSPSKLQYEYNEETILFLDYLIENYIKKIENNKDIKKIVIINVFLFQKYYIYHPQNLINAFSDIINFDYILDDNSQQCFELGNNFQLFLSNDLIKEYLKIINDKMKNDKDNSICVILKKYLIDFLINIIKVNLYRVLQDENEEIIYLIFELIYNCNNNDIREYIMNNLLIFLVNSLTVEKYNNWIHQIKLFLSYEDEKEAIGNNINIQKLIDIFHDERFMALYILGAFIKGIYLYVPEKIQEIIIFFKFLYKNIYKGVGSGARIIKQFINNFLEKYEYSLYYVRENLSDECDNVIRDLSSSSYYFC